MLHQLVDNFVYLQKKKNVDISYSYPQHTPLYQLLLFTLWTVYMPACFVGTPAPSWLRASSLELSSDHMRSSTAVLTSGWQTAQCVVQVNFFRWLKLPFKYWCEGRAISGVNIFSPALVISISPLSFLPCHPPWCHTNASLLFHWAHWHGRFPPPPQWCSGPKLNSSSLLSTTAGETGWERMWIGIVRAGGLIKRRLDD